MIQIPAKGRQLTYPWFAHRMENSAATARDHMGLEQVPKDGARVYNTHGEKRRERIEVYAICGSTLANFKLLKIYKFYSDKFTIGKF